jgi:hypothetical protein
MLSLCSKGHNLNADLINMTHVIKHLSFGKHVPGRPSYVPRALRRTWRRIPKDMGGRFAAGNESTYVSAGPESDKISHIIILDDHVDTVVSHVDNVILRSSSVWILLSQGRVPYQYCHLTISWTG